MAKEDEKPTYNQDWTGRTALRTVDKDNKETNPFVVGNRYTYREYIGPGDNDYYNWTGTYKDTDLDGNTRFENDEGAVIPAMSKSMSEWDSQTGQSIYDYDNSYDKVQSGGWDYYDSPDYMTARDNAKKRAGTYKEKKSPQINTSANQDWTGRNSIHVEYKDGKYINPFIEGNRYTTSRKIGITHKDGTEEYGDFYYTGIYSGVDANGNPVFKDDDGNVIDAMSNDLRGYSQDSGVSGTSIWPYDPKYDASQSGGWDYNGNTDVTQAKNYMAMKNSPVQATSTETPSGNATGTGNVDSAVTVSGKPLSVAKKRTSSEPDVMPTASKPQNSVNAPATQANKSVGGDDDEYYNNGKTTMMDGEVSATAKDLSKKKEQPKKEPAETDEINPTGYKPSIYNEVTDAENGNPQATAMMNKKFAELQNNIKKNVEIAQEQRRQQAENARKANYMDFVNRMNKRRSGEMATQQKNRNNYVFTGEQIEGMKGSLSGVQPLDVEPLTGAGAFTPPETKVDREDPELQAKSIRLDMMDEMMKKAAPEAYAGTHPWVTNDLATMRQNYKNLTGAQLLADYTEYKRSKGEEPTLAEAVTIMQGADPNQTYKQERRQKNREAWAERINQIGDFLANLVNYGRAKAGNPIANIQPSSNTQAERLRQANEQLSKQRYQDYLNAWNSEQTQKQKEKDDKTKFEQQKEMKQLEWNSPMNQLKLKGMVADLESKQQKAELLKTEIEYKKARNQGLSEQEAQKKALFELDKRIKELKLKNGGKSGKDKDEDKSTKQPYQVKGNDGKTYKFSTPEQAYQYGCYQKGIKPKDNVTPERLKEAGVTILGQ